MAENMATDSSQFVCIICGQSGLDEGGMQSHMLTEHVEQNICCPFCDLGGITSDEMTLHINSVHFEDMFSPVSEEPVKVNGSIPTPPERDVKVALEFPQTSVENPSGHDCDTDTSSLDKNNFAISRRLPSADSELSKMKACSGLKEQDIKRARLHLDVMSPGSVLQVGSSAAVCNGSEVEPIQGTSHAIHPPSVSSVDPERDYIITHRQIPDINFNVEPDINSNVPGVFYCPMCQFSTNSESGIQSHVNNAHIDILSPQNLSKSKLKVTNGDSKISTPISHAISPCGGHVCPICNLILESVTALEIHVNTKHLDILSPGGKSGQICSPSLNQKIDGWVDCVVCPVCDQEFQDPSCLETHVNGHFSAEQTPVQEMTDQLLAEELHSQEQKAVSEEKQFQALQAMFGMTEGTTYKKQYERNLDRAVLKGDLTVPEYHERKHNLKFHDLNGIDDGHSVTKGVITSLIDYYKSATNMVANTWMCSYVDHYAASFGDKGWGCGYRNLQMLLSSIATNSTYCKVLFNGKPQIPSLPKIQRLIEAAWEKGFDKQGSEQLGGRVVDTTKWIGATEIVACLSSLKAKCRLLDFHNPSGPNGTHPKLFQWVKEYFEQKSAFKPPLYLQHQGHSRTIVGVEEWKDKSLRLLIFDPSTPKKQMQQFQTVVNSNMIRMLRRSIQGLKAKQYQIVCVAGILDGKEYEESKILKSERIS
ncbi:hypothetical protein ScPMuIL_013222 [Solemya velum]